MCMLPTGKTAERYGYPVLSAGGVGLEKRWPVGPGRGVLGGRKHGRAGVRDGTPEIRAKPQSRGFVSSIAF